MPFAVLGVVPARGGSKGIPNKNLALLEGRPLLAYTADAVLQSTRVTRTVVSTDDPAIADVARGLGLDVPFLRPDAMAGAASPDIEWQMVRAEGFQPDAIVLLQPTSPLRRAEHIDAAIALLEETGSDSVVSVVDVPHHFNPASVMRLDGERLRPFLEEPSVTRRQDKPRVLARNGPAVLAMRAATVDGGSLYGDDCRPLLMGAEESLDIDTPWDLLLAEYFLGRRRAP